MWGDIIFLIRHSPEQHYGLKRLAVAVTQRLCGGTVVKIPSVGHGAAFAVAERGDIHKA